MTTSFIPLTDRFFAAPQIEAADIQVVKEQGITLIVNNRPENEAPDQPAGDEIKAAAQTAGLAYIAIPVGAAGISETDLDDLMRAIDASDGPVLAYCKSGMRSVILRAFALARRGHDADALVAEAHAAGFDISGQHPTLKALAAQNL